MHICDLYTFSENTVSCRMSVLGFLFVCLSICMFVLLVWFHFPREKLLKHNWLYQINQVALLRHVCVRVRVGLYIIVCGVQRFFVMNWRLPLDCVVVLLSFDWEWRGEVSLHECPTTCWLCFGKFVNIVHVCCRCDCWCYRCRFGWQSSWLTELTVTVANVETFLHCLTKVSISAYLHLFEISAYLIDDTTQSNLCRKRRKIYGCFPTTFC